MLTCKNTFFFIFNNQLFQSVSLVDNLKFQKPTLLIFNEHEKFRKVHKCLQRKFIGLGIYGGGGDFKVKTIKLPHNKSLSFEH